MLVKRTFLENALSEVMMGWGGVEGGHVTVPCNYFVCYMSLRLDKSLVLLLRDKSRARIWPNLAHTNVRFAVAKTTFCLKNVRFTSTVPAPPGC